MYSTIVGSGPGTACRGQMSQALIGWPSKPPKVTSAARTVRRRASIPSKLGVTSRAWLVRSVSAQNASKSPGSSIGGR